MRIAGKHSVDGYITARPETVYMDVSVDEGKRPDIKHIALELAEHLLANGFIDRTEVLRYEDADGQFIRFFIRAFRSKNKLP